MAGVLLGLSLLVAAGEAERDKHKDAPGDAKAIAGVWKVVSAMQSGQAAPMYQGMLFEFTADIVVMKAAVNGKHEPFAAAKYTLDAAKNPKGIDLSIELDPAKPIIQPGIYELQGDELKLSLEAAGLPRPTRFVTRAGGACNLFVLKRVK